ncbi:MAG: threonine/serine dehydratase [candidate division KSB1 bacterium]|nr:threonine/serine dehydratase [candidate division KSB1 bacterium]
MSAYSPQNISAKKAYRLIKKYIRETPLEPCGLLSQLTRGRVFLKMEHWQKTGSFKLRGALTRLLTLSPEQKERGVIAASAGNHGLGLAMAGAITGVKSRIVLPVNAARTKVQMLGQFGIEIIQAGRDYDEAEDVAMQIARDCQLTFISGFDDPIVISGQGTIAIEIFRELSQPDVILVPVGGGGLISGIAITAKQFHPATSIIGVQSEASPAMYRALQLNMVVETPIEETIADGLAGRLVSPTIFATIQHYVDDMILVSEQEIVSAILWLLQYHHTLVEGAAAVGVAALLSGKINIEGKNCVAILTGRNIDIDRVKTILNRTAPDGAE